MTSKPFETLAAGQLERHRAAAMAALRDYRDTAARVFRIADREGWNVERGGVPITHAARREMQHAKVALRTVENGVKGEAV